MVKYCIFHVEGGIGKNIMATALVDQLKAVYHDRELIVVASWPAVWFNNPNVFRVYPSGNTQYFYEDFLKDKDTIILKHEPYHHHNYINGSKHLINVWAEMSMPYNAEVGELNPKLFLSNREISFVRNSILSSIPSGKDVCVIQSSGGGANNAIPYSWVRDIPPHQAVQIVQALNKKYTFVQIRRDDQFEIPGCVQYKTQNIRQLLCIASIFDKFILIDSVMQHAAKSFGKNAVVCWPVDNVKKVGYDTNTNILSRYASLPILHNIDGIYGNTDITGGIMYNCPFPNDDVFSITEIVEHLLK